MLKICEKIFAKLMTEKIDYCHWKSNEHLDEGLNGQTDLDILVAEVHAKKFSEVLIRCECLKVHPQFGSRYPGVDEWIGYDRETGRLIHLHVHFRIITGTKHIKEYILPWHNQALKTKVLDETRSVYIVEPNLELIILYTRIVLKLWKPMEKSERFKLPVEYRKEVLWLKQRIDTGKLSKWIGIIWKQEQKSVLPIFLREELTKDDFVKLHKFVIDKVAVVKRGRIFDNAATAALRRKAVCIKGVFKDKYDIVPYTTLKTLYGRGRAFVFIGCDGSGKSTITKEICKWLGWKMDCQNFYFGMGERYKKPFIYKLLQSKWMPDIVREAASMLFYYHISVRCKYMRELVDIYINKGGIAICDRYPQTQFKGIYDGPKIQALGLCDQTAFGKFLIEKEEQNIQEAASKKVDAVFKLVVPAEIALKRSPGHDAREVKRKALITEILQFIDCDVYEIDATKPLKEELLEIKGLIWNKLLEDQ